MSKEKKRDPAEVIEAVLQHVPENMPALRANLQKVARDSAFLPPEGKGVAWLQMAMLLSESLPFPPETEWQKEIYRIVTMKEI